MEPKIIISASRRTDIPAFYPEWFIRQLQQGYAETKHKIPLDKAHVHSIVLWSKNFAPLLKSIHAVQGYQFFFMFTLNDCPYLEPHVPPLEQRFNQLEYIIRTFGKERLFIRFDPIAHWKQEGVPADNLASFEKIVKKISLLGIPSVKTSFLDTHYKKLNRRNVAFSELPPDEKRTIACQLAAPAARYGVRLQFCCNDYLFAADLFTNRLPPGIEKSCCIDGKLISSIIGEPTIETKDTSQRKECRCTYTLDIGSYKQQCMHGCRYCYANPVKEE